MFMLRNEKDQLIVTSLLNRGMIEEERFETEKGLLSVYLLTRKGKSHVKKNLLKQRKIHVRNVSEEGVLHDLKLATIYLSLTPKERRSWVTAKDVRLFLDSAGHGDLPELDAMYIDEEGKRVGVEVKSRYPGHLKARELKKSLAVFDSSILTASFSLDYYMKTAGDESKS